MKINVQDLIKEKDDYILLLSEILNSLNKMAAMHNWAIQMNVFENDEIEQIGIIKYHTVCAFASIRTLLELVGENTQIDIEKIKQRLNQRLTTREFDGSNMSSNTNNDTTGVDNTCDEKTKQPVSGLRKKRGRPPKIRNQVVGIQNELSYANNGSTT